MAVVVDQHHGFKPPVRSQRCRLQSFTQLDYFTLESDQIDIGQVDVASFHRSFSTPCLTITRKVEEEPNSNPRIELLSGQGSPRVRALVVEVAIAMASGVELVPVPNGLGGAYFLCNRNGDTIAVAKPIDEEPLAVNNPKGFTGRMPGQPGLKRSVRVGETGMRELAAYLLDHGGFAGVPPTALVKISHLAFHVNSSLTISAPEYKIASLQSFVDHDCDTGDLGPSGFSVSSVHRIGILDIRLLNIDRHSGNILVKKNEQEHYSHGAAELVPIDHGLCLPEWLDDPYFEWLHWPQASVPFSESELDYIANLDPFEDAKLLRLELPCLSESSIRVLIICTMFLKRAAASGLCLCDIGEMMTRDFYGGEETLSMLEDICLRAKETMRLISFDNHFDYEESEERENDGIGVFQFDEELEFNPPKVLHGPHIIAKPPCIPKFPPPRPTNLGPSAPLGLLEEYRTRDSDHRAKTGLVDSYNSNLRILTKSTSCAEPKGKSDMGGVSFREMKEEEWELFLELFEKFVPEVFKDRKSTGLMQRAGTA